MHEEVQYHIIYGKAQFLTVFEGNQRFMPMGFMLVQVTSGPVSDWRICSLFGVLGWARCLREQWETRKCQVEGEFPRGETALFAPGALLALMLRECCLVSSWAVIAVLRGAGHTFFKEVKKAGEVQWMWVSETWMIIQLVVKTLHGPGLVGQAWSRRERSWDTPSSSVGSPPSFTLIDDRHSRITQNHHVRAQVVLRVMTDVLYTHAAASLVPGAEAEAPPKEEPADSKFQLKSRLLFTRFFGLACCLQPPLSGFYVNCQR